MSEFKLTVDETKLRVVSAPTWIAILGWDEDYDWVGPFVSEAQADMWIAKNPQRNGRSKKLVSPEEATELYSS